MYLGVDAGGTKTEALLIAENGDRLAACRYGPGNWEAIGLDNALALYAHIIADMCRQAAVDPSSVTSVGWGLAGLDWESDHKLLAPRIAAVFPTAVHTCVNDAFLPLRAGSTRPYGVAVIAGTGSTVAAIGRTGRQARTYGLGSDWGDFDGAQQLTRAAFRATARVGYGLEQATVLTQELLSWAQVDSIAALAEAFTRGGDVPDLATFAPTVMRCADAGDAVAQQIIVDAAQLLSQNICAMSHAVGLADSAFDVILAGGVATGAAPLFHSTMRQSVQAVCPLAEIMVLQRPPVVGALLLAMDAVGSRIQLNLREW